MALLTYGNKTVDDKFTALTEPNLYNNQPFQPGISFTDKYTIGPAGQILVHKPGTKTITAAAPGSDFSDTDTADTQIIIILNKAYQASEKIYNAVAATVAYPVVAANMEVNLQSIAEAWQSDLATELETTTTVSAATTTVLDKTNVYGIIVDDREVLVTAKAKPNTLIVSPATFGVLLQSPEFQRTGDIGDMVVSEAQVGRIAGLNVFEYQGMAALTDYLMYDFDALSAVSAIQMARAIDSELFNGVKVQNEIVSGFKLTNVARALKKLHA
jgi:hypothetical protein